MGLFPLRVRVAVFWTRSGDAGDAFVGFFAGVSDDFVGVKVVKVH
jgi:hypothetical protein